MLFFVCTLICFVSGSFLFMLYWCPTRFPYQIMFVSLIVTRRVPLVEKELPTLLVHLSSPQDSSCSIFSFLFNTLIDHCFYFWPLSFNLITSLISSNFSFIRNLNILVISTSRFSYCFYCVLQHIGHDDFRALQFSFCKHVLFVLCKIKIDRNTN